MWKIIKKSIEKIVLNKKKFSLWMKWEFKIEFANDSFWPYQYKFEREDCYYNDGLEDRWSVIFPLKNKKFDNIEIFIETDDIVVCIGERWNLSWGEKTFIDIINIKTEKKYRFFTDEVNLIFNSEDKIIINAKDEWVFKTIVLNSVTLEKIEEVEESLLSFFKSVYNAKEDSWYLLDFNANDKNEIDEEKKYRKWSFILQKVNTKWKPISFDRKKFEVKTDIWFIDIWEESLI